ncbi:N-acetylglucosaminidase [Salimicrobium halophilum]|nr:glucosaminidase domain-containing protein [Salimicrobium halophilum]
MKWLTPVLVLLAIFAFATCAQAETKEWGEEINVPADKVWHIEFNTELKASSVNPSTVIIKNENGERVPDLDISLMEDGKTVKVDSKVDYPVDTKYTLHILDNIESRFGNKALKEKVELTFHVSKEFQTVTLNGLDDWELGTSYDTLREGVQNAQNGQVIIKNGSVLWAPEGSQLATDAFTVFYNDASLTSQSTYVSGQTELDYVRSHNEAIEAEIAGRTVFVKPEDVTFIPEAYQKGESYYKNAGGTLQHTIYRPLSESYATYSYGKAPASMDEGETVTSWDGRTFNGEEAKFFNHMDLRRQSHYTGEMLDEYISSRVPDSPLIGHGDAFVKVGEEYGINALYLMAHAIHESAWGKSRIAQDKNNLFGIDAHDGNAYEAAMEYESFEASIRYLVEEKLTKQYLVEDGSYFNGYTLGNKSTGMNVKYASDPYWGQKIAGHMYMADQHLGGYDQKLLEDEDYVAEKFEEESDDENNGDQPADEGKAE